MWPFRGKPEPETRANYTDALVEAIVSQAGGFTQYNPLKTAAAEIAARSYAHAFAVAKVSPASPELAGLTSRILADIARELILRGESAHVIDVASGRVRLRSASYGWTVRGGPDEATWRYLVSLAAPTDQISRDYPGASILHARYSTDPATPHIGIGPFTSASQSAKLAAAIELNVANEAQGPHGWILPVPDEGLQDSDLAELETKFKQLRGRTALVSSSRSNFGDGGAAQRSEYEPKRFGLDVPESTPKLRQDAIHAMLGSAGVPAELWSVGTTSSSRREAWRQFLHGSVAPLAEIMTVELREKLHPRATLSFENLFASDIQGRARAFQSLAGGGMDISAAAAASGILNLED